MDSPETTGTARPMLDLDEARSARVAALPPVRVLIVEDDYDSVRLASRRLNWSPTANFEVSWAASLPEALACLETEDFDAVVLDLSLPGSEGVKTLGGISALAHDIPIVVLTGSDSDSLAMTAARSGVQDYLVKERQDGRSLARSILAAIERQRRESGRPAHEAIAAVSAA